jgi:hypothetical protein
MTTWVTARGIALAVGVLTPPLWLLWAEHLAGGWRTVLASAGLWWLAALQATWPVWLPAAVTLGALWLALPPRPPHRRGGHAPAEPPAPTVAPAGESGARTALSDWHRLTLTERIMLSRTPEGAAALAAEQREAARRAGVRAPEVEAAAPAPDDAGEAGEDADREEEREGNDGGLEDGAGSDDEEAGGEEDEDRDEDDGEDAEDDEDDEDEPPEGQDPPQDSTPAPPRAVGPASGPAPPRTVWEAFAPLHQEDDDDEGDDDAA